MRSTHLGVLRRVHGLPFSPSARTFDLHRTGAWFAVLRVVTAGLVAVLGQGLSSIQELSAVVYAAYVADVGRLLNTLPQAPPISNAMSGQVLKNPLATSRHCVAATLTPSLRF